MNTYLWAMYYIIQSIKKVWAMIDLQALAHHIGGAHAESVLAAFYFIISFGSGYYFRRHIKFTVGSIIVTFVTMKIFEQYGLIKVDWINIYVALGMGPTGDVGLFISSTITWIKVHTLLFLATVIGFIIGAKLG